MATLIVTYDGPEHPDYPYGGARFVLEAPDDTPLRSVLQTVIAVPTHTPHSLVVGYPDMYAPMVIDGQVTIRQAQAFAGDDPLHIDTEGRGGDGEIYTLMGLIDLGLTAWGLWDAGVRINDVATALKFSEERREAGEWIELGSPAEVPLRLEQLVKARAEWTIQEFGAAFGLSVEECVSLLRALGYRRERVLGMPLWRDPVRNSP